MSTEQNKQLVQLDWFGRAGDWIKKNQRNIVLVSGFIFVALVAFGAGYLSIPGQSKSQIVIDESGYKNTINGQTANIGAGESLNANAGISGVMTAGQNTKGLIVASKNSKIYHWPWEASAKKIKPENQVWFRSEAEAQASGRTKSADFDNQAPAGYIKK